MAFILVRVNSNGTLSNVDGTVRSLNPTGAGAYVWQTRPAGTAGAFELITIDGGTVAFNPLGTEPVLFPFKPSVPNAPGMSVLGTVRLVE